MAQGDARHRGEQIAHCVSRSGDCGRGLCVWRHVHHPRGADRQSIARLPGAKLGSKITIELPDGTQRELEIVGTVHDFTAVPASRIPILTGYVSLDTLSILGLSNRYDELQIITTPELITEGQ